MTSLTVPAWLNRRTLLHAMLGALGCAAASGVLAVFASSSSLWRFTGMALAAGVAAGVMMPMAALAERERSRAAALFGMAWAVGMFVLVVGVIWGNLTPLRLEEMFASLAGATVVAGIPTMLLLTGVASEEDRVGALTGCAVCAAGWMVLLVASFQIVLHDRETSEKLWATGASMVASGALIGACLSGARSQTTHLWRHLGSLSAIAAVCMVVYSMWVHRSDEEHWLVGAYALAGVIAHANLARRVPLKGAQFVVRWVSVGTAAIAGGCIFGMAYTDSSWSDALGFHRIATGAGLVAFSTTLALIVLAKLNARPTDRVKAVGLSAIFFRCPRCRCEQEHPLGDCVCNKCRLRLSISASVPICPGCQYDLSDCRDERCPECGRAIGSVPGGESDDLTARSAV